MAVVKTKKATTREVCKAKKLAMVAKLGSAKKLPRMPKAPKAQVAQVVKLQFDVEDIFQAVREVVRLKMEVEWAKLRARRVEEGPSVLSMNAMAEAIKVLQTLMVSKRETNMQLSLELKEAQREKGHGPSKEATKAMKTQMLDPFMGKDTEAKKVR
ncbi:unnamed protein product [Sphagnum jensenii]